MAKDACHVGIYLQSPAWTRHSGANTQVCVLCAQGGQHTAPGVICQGLREDPVLSGVPGGLSSRECL